MHQGDPTTPHEGAHSSVASARGEGRDKSYACAAPSLLAGHPGRYTCLSLPARSHTGETTGCSPPGAGALPLANSLCNPVPELALPQTGTRSG